MKRIVISGYYGSGNVGDEAVLDGILIALRQVGIEARITVLSADPIRTKAQHNGVESIPRLHPLHMFRAVRRADLVVSGGGSLLQDVTSARSLRYYLFVLRLAQMMGRKTMVFAQGVGPLTSERSRKAVAHVLNRTDAITVRDEDSKAVLETIGVRVAVTQAADPSFLVESDLEAADALLADLGLTDPEIIGVSLRPWPGIAGWLEGTAKGIGCASASIGARAVVIPMEQAQDREVCESADVGAVVGEQLAPRTAKGVFARCSLVVGMRLHALMFAADAGVPFVALAYDPKVWSFAQAVRQEPVIGLESLDAQIVSDGIVRAWAERGERRNTLVAKTDDRRRLALVSAGMARDILARL